MLPVDAAGRPLPFQELMRRFRRVQRRRALVREVPVRLRALRRAPGRRRAAHRPAVRGALGPRSRRRAAAVATVARVVAGGRGGGRGVLAARARRGLEGVMVKGLDAPYTPGMRGGAWLKVKRVVSVDLVIVAADRGYGRRHGWLSNYHLAARDEADRRARARRQDVQGTHRRRVPPRMTERLSALGRRARRAARCSSSRRWWWRCCSADLQRSPTYRAGLALRFARIARIRDDKAPADADTLAHLRALLAAPGRRWHAAHDPPSVAGVESRALSSHPMRARARSPRSRCVARWPRPRGVPTRRCGSSSTPAIGSPCA